LHPYHFIQIKIFQLIHTYSFFCLITLLTSAKLARSIFSIHAKKASTSYKNVLCFSAVNSGNSLYSLINIAFQNETASACQSSILLVSKSARKSYNAAVVWIASSSVCVLVLSL